MTSGFLRRTTKALSGLALVALAGLVSGAVLAADAVFPRGSALGLVPPPGMVESPTFAGFEDRDHNASILLVDMPPEAFAQLEAGFTDQALATKGIQVEHRGPFAVEGAKGVLVSGVQNVGPLHMRKWILLTGNEATTGLVTVQVPEDQAAALSDEAVRAALSTLAFRSVAEQAATLPFTLTDLAGFRVLRTFAGSTAILTDGPKDILEGPDQPYFVVSVAAGSPREDERRQFALRALSSLTGLRDLRIERAEPLRINKSAGFEVMADAVDAKTGEKVKVVQWLRFGQTGHIRMVAVSRLDAFPDLYSRFRAIRDGVEGR